MSSRTGDVITADAMLEQVADKLREYASDDTTVEPMSVGAVKYSILRQSPGQDIIFDFEKSLSVEGDSGPYVVYAYARLKSILRKAEVETIDFKNVDATLLDSENELALIRKMLELPDVVARAAELNAPSGLVNYIYKFAVAANKFYETTPILKDENTARRTARLALAELAARTIKDGLALLGIRTLEKI
jgi:arginyl-tRNA synthetase